MNSTTCVRCAYVCIYSAFQVTDTALSQSLCVRVEAAGYTSSQSKWSYRRPSHRSRDSQCLTGTQFASSLKALTAQSMRIDTRNCGRSCKLLLPCASPSKSCCSKRWMTANSDARSEEHTSELQSL